jgi:hypothetical protein
MAHRSLTVAALIGTKNDHVTESLQSRDREGAVSSHQIAVIRGRGPAGQALVARHAGIDFDGPGIDPAIHALDVGEPLLCQVARSIHAAPSHVAVKDDRSVLRPGQNLLRQFVRQECCSFNMSDGMFFLSPHIDEPNGAVAQRIGNLAHRDSNIACHGLRL